MFYYLSQKVKLLIKTPYFPSFYVPLILHFGAHLPCALCLSQRVVVHKFIPILPWKQSWSCRVQLTSMVMRCKSGTLLCFHALTSLHWGCRCRVKLKTFGFSPGVSEINYFLTGESDKTRVGQLCTHWARVGDFSPFHTYRLTSVHL